MIEKEQIEKKNEEKIEQISDFNKNEENENIFCGIIMDLKKIVCGIFQNETFLNLLSKKI